MITTTLELALATLAAEFALLAVVFATLLWRRGQRQQAAAAQDVDALVANVAQSTAPRREALLAALRESYKFDGEESARVVSDFIEREQAFYNMLIGVHLGRGGKTLADVPAEVTRLVAPWLELKPRATTDEAAVADLESRNSALSAELDATKKVLDDLMHEYSAAFLRSGNATPDLSLDLEAPADEDPLAPNASGLREVSVDQLLSMDEFDPTQLTMPAAAPAAAENEPDAPAVAVDADQEVIDLATEAAATGDDPLPMSTEEDLDALMQNLGLDAGAPESRPQAAA